MLFYGLFALACYLGWRLYDVQIVHGGVYARDAHRQQSALFRVSARRGSISTSDGVLLARSLPSQSVYADASARAGVSVTAARLAPVLHEPAAAIANRILAQRFNHSIAWKIPDAQAKAIRALALPGINVQDETTGKRFVPSGELASTVLGFVGRDDNGLAGVEYAFDDILRGRPGLETLETDEFARALPFSKAHYVEAPKSGDDIVLTLDSYLQFTTQRALADTVHQFSARSGTAIVMDPQTGAILALANVPNYDVREYARYPPDDWRDRAVTDAYEPGSTFKLVTAAAALESGRVTTASQFATRDRMEIGGATIYNAEDGFMAGTGSSETLADIIAYSHNVGAAEVGLAIGGRAFYRQVRKFGFGDETAIGLPGESAGIVPPPSQWSATSLATMAFGQGVAVTPLALIRAYAAIANGGWLLRPRILDAIVAPDGRVVYRYGREVERRALSARTAATLRGFLRAVVLRGTGNPSAHVAGYTTAGKTGTAQIAEGGGYAPGEYTASFVGFIPAERPRFVILVKVERPRGSIYGSVVAAPAFAQIARTCMLHAGVMPQLDPPRRRLVGPTRTSKPRE
jgi:cell division protein FtsI/penicillin-binding protein 2